MTLVLRSKNEVKQATDLLKCRSCEVEKPKEKYYKGRRKCKECIKQRVKKWKKENPDIHIKYCEKWRVNNRERVNEYSKEYQKKHYDPVKQKIKNYNYYWGGPEMTGVMTQNVMC